MNGPHFLTVCLAALPSWRNRPRCFPRAIIHVAHNFAPCTVLYLGPFTNFCPNLHSCPCLRFWYRLPNAPINHTDQCIILFPSFHFYHGSEDFPCPHFLLGLAKGPSKLIHYPWEKSVGSIYCPEFPPSASGLSKFLCRIILTEAGHDWKIQLVRSRSMKPKVPIFTPSVLFLSHKTPTLFPRWLLCRGKERLAYALISTINYISRFVAPIPRRNKIGKYMGLPNHVPCRRNIQNAGFRHRGGTPSCVPVNTRLGSIKVLMGFHRNWFRSTFTSLSHLPMITPIIRNYESHRLNAHRVF